MARLNANAATAHAILEVERDLYQTNETPPLGAAGSHDETSIPGGIDKPSVTQNVDDSQEAFGRQLKQLKAHNAAVYATARLGR